MPLLIHRDYVLGRQWLSHQRRWIGSVPLAISGALVVGFLDLTTINIYSQVGLITQVGLIAKDGILIV